MLYRIQSTTLTTEGRNIVLLSDATVTVTDTAGNIASIYEDPDGLIPTDNPFLSGSTGGYDFYVDTADFYDVLIEKDGLSVDERVYPIVLSNIQDALNLSEAAAEAAAASAATIPAPAPDTMMVASSDGLTRENRTFAQVRSDLDMVSNIMDFGAFGNGVDYDDDAFTAAANASGAIYLPPRTYRFSDGYKCVVPISSFGKSFFSDGPRGTGFDFRRSALIKTNTTGADVSGGTGAAAFDFHNSQGQLMNLSFLHTGTAKDADARAVRFDHEHTGINTDDIDSRVFNCAFSDYGVAVRQNGRGINMQGGTIGNCEDGVVWSFPATGTEGDVIQSDPILGSRAFRVQGVRGHNIASLVKQTGSVLLRAFMIEGNELDLGDTLFQGGAEDGIIASNICRFSEGREGGVYVTIGGSRLQILGNTFGGGTLAGAMSGTVGVEFVAPNDVEDTIIANNVMDNYAWCAIRFGSGARPYRCQILGNVGTNLGRDAIELASGSFMTRIQGGAMSNYGVDGTTRGGVKLTGTHDRLTVKDIDLDPVQATARNILFSGTASLGDSHIKELNSTYATAISGTYTDAGGNDISTGNRL